MGLKLLLDEHISEVVAEQVRRNRPEIGIQSVHFWRDGAFEGRVDRDLLLAARDEECTVVTYDLSTIPILIAELYEGSESHSGVIFVDDLSIPSSNFGMLVRALIAHWDRHNSIEWDNRVMFIERLRER
jgi:hypothetical protein